MKPVINQELCIGCGTCEGMCPEVFKLTNGKAQVLKIDDYSQYKDKIEQSVAACPVSCISIEE